MFIVYPTPKNIQHGIGCNQALTDEGACSYALDHHAYHGSVLQTEEYVFIQGTWLAHDQLINLRWR